MSHPVLLHLVYIHGFQGDHTSFQSFPTDLHDVLQPLLPRHITLRSTVYPTYPSRRPVSDAVKAFLKWMVTLPDGPVILCGHSMGGLLAADAAHKSRRVIGLLACDVPFLGMHPHVVISGLASLIPTKKKKQNGVSHGVTPIAIGNSELRSEAELNDKRRVHMEETVPDLDMSSDDPQTCSSPSSIKSHTGPLLSPPLPPRPPRPTRLSDVSPPPSVVNDIYVNSPLMLASPSPVTVGPPPLSTRPSSCPPLTPPTPPFDGSTSQSLSATPSTSLSPPDALSRTLDLLRIPPEPLLSFLRADDRTGFIIAHAEAFRKETIEFFEFGICMFDPNGLMERYKKLEKWQGHFKAWWTIVPPKEKKAEATNHKLHQTKKSERGLRALVHAGNSLAAAVSSVELKTPVPVDVGSDKHDKEKPHHFVVTPHRKDRWEAVEIRGAKDEVEAHCGLFIKDLNLEYDDFVKRVAVTVTEWAEKL